ncbi:TonB-dependent receptor [Niveispirillum cyanobacteriorum]|uniref:TonB-dependent receptor n=1 Tax=Niveispirillum cyanobacteriorum TaxID=1612173 RepID=A0A2K9NJA2_9PROT|nr:TonB-dependent receptor [Niveispirillum cyanobacteriorum]AUN33168.1 TonB-dependent receptor [Niveispirillum cyanobacteriorum]GGE51118.1 TonB-dependent receptor [Niveispirillum cyanobacteriorum]
MARSSWRFGSLAGVSALALAATGPASAQSTNQAGASTIEEVVVTGLRRPQAQQNVPAAVTAFTADAIEMAGIEKPADFIDLTSNVTLVETQNAGNAFIIIRGITQARNSEPSVAVIVDGVQQVNAAQFSQELFDIDQIEVLKGPQGALYGRNAIGGAIVIRTKQPTDTFDTRVKVGVENGFGYSARAGISGPLSEKVKFRLAGSYVNSDGLIRNAYLDEKADPYEDLSLRGTLLFQPTDNLTVDLRGSVSRLRTQALYFNIVNDVNNTSLPVRVNNPGQNDRDMNGTSLRVAYETDAGTLTSVTSYDQVKEILTGDAFDFLPITESLFYQILGFDLNQSQYLNVKAWSEEIRFASPTDQPFQWSVGGYMIGTKRYISTGNMIDRGQGVFPVYRTPSTNPRNPQFSFLADAQDNFAWALFGSTSYDLSEKLTADLSLRYDKDKRENTTLTPTAYLPNVAGFPAGRSGEVRNETFTSWQPKATLTYKADEALTLYTGYSKGFRSGGFNQTGVGAVAAANGILGVSDVFKAETASTLEAGFKSQLMDRRLRLNGSVYNTISDNSYFFVFLAANSTQNLGNVPETRLRGFELDATAFLTTGLQVNLGFGFTDSKIKEFADPTVLGNEAPLISRYTFNMGVQYSTELSDSGLTGTARADYRRIGKTWFDIQNSTVRDPLDLVDVRLGIEGEGWNLSAYSDNLFNKKYNAEFSPGGFVFKGRPRRYGLEAGVKF